MIEISNAFGAITKYSNLTTGMVFRFSSEFKCKGLKTREGYIHLENIFGESLFGYHPDNEEPEKDVVIEGKLSGITVQ